MPAYKRRHHHLGMNQLAGSDNWLIIAAISSFEAKPDSVQLTLTGRSAVPSSLQATIGTYHPRHQSDSDRTDSQGSAPAKASARPHPTRVADASSRKATISKLLQRGIAERSNQSGHKRRRRSGPKSLTVPIAVHSHADLSRGGKSCQPVCSVPGTCQFQCPAEALEVVNRPSIAKSAFPPSGA